MEQGLVVFLCSTYNDLSAEREAVLDAVRRLQLQHDSMEFFGARTSQALETCLAEVRRSNMLVVVVGHRYGSLVPGADVSFSEAEYNEGFRLGKPCLVYMRDDDVPILPRHIERDPDRVRALERWKTSLQQRHTISYFREASDLAVQVAADIGRTATELSESYRARKAAEQAISEGLIWAEAKDLITRALQRGVSESNVLTLLRHDLAALAGDAPNVYLSYAGS